MIHVLFISLIVFAIHYCFQKGEILGITQRIPLGKLADPIRDCPVCMVFWYGTVIYLLAWRNPTPIGWALTIFASMGLNAVIVGLMPDKETPTLHEGLHEISTSIDKLNDNSGTTGKAQIKIKRKV